jgi:hypothetical protein
MSSSDTTTINHKDCIYGCNTRIYWNTLTSEYLEVVSKKKHVCPNRSTNNNYKSVSLTATKTNNNTITTKPAAAVYYNNNNNNNYKNNYNNNHNYKKSWNSKTNNKQPAPMDNSLEILQGTTDTIRKQYEILSDLIKEYGGKTMALNLILMQIIPFI